MISLMHLWNHWVIGDIHGCADALSALLRCLPAKDRLIFCGDVINRGPQIERAMQLAWTQVMNGRAVWLMGNHEQRFVQQLSVPLADSEPPSDCMLQLGQQRCLVWANRLKSLPVVHWGDGWVATHAGFDPCSWQPDVNIRLPFWQAYDGRFGEVIVGHTPGAEVRRINKVVLIDTGARFGGKLSAYCPETGDIRSVPGLDPRRRNSQFALTPATTSA